MQSEINSEDQQQIHNQHQKNSNGNFLYYFTRGTEFPELQTDQQPQFSYNLFAYYQRQSP